MCVPLYPFLCLRTAVSLQAAYELAIATRVRRVSIVVIVGPARQITEDLFIRHRLIYRMNLNAGSPFPEPPHRDK